MKYQYFICYSFKKGDMNGDLRDYILNCEISRTTPIESIEDINEIEEAICKKNSISHVTVINWRLF